MAYVDPSIPGIHHLCLSVSDIRASLEFYGRLMALLGWKVRASGSSACYTVANYEIYLEQSDEPDYAPRRYGVGLQHLAFNAPSRATVDAVHAAVLAMGAEVTDPPKAYPKYTPQYYAVFFKDPSGVQLEVCYAPDLEL